MGKFYRVDFIDKGPFNFFCIIIAEMSLCAISIFVYTHTGVRIIL